MKLHSMVDLKANPDKVWYWLSNPEKAKMWQTNVTKDVILKQTPDMIGTTFRETIEENGGSTEMQGVITGYRENELLAMHLSGKYNVVDVEWRIEQKGEHTRLVASFDTRFRSFLGIMSVLFRPVFKKKILEQLQAEFSKLKELCESDK